MFYVAGLDGHIQREVKLNAWKRTLVRFLLLTKFLGCDKLFLVENVKVFAHLLSGGDNDFGDSAPYWKF